MIGDPDPDQGLEVERPLREAKQVGALDCVDKIGNIADAIMAGEQCNLVFR